MLSNASCTCVGPRVINADNADCSVGCLHSRHSVNLGMWLRMECWPSLNMSSSPFWGVKVRLDRDLFPRISSSFDNIGIVYTCLWLDLCWVALHLISPSKYIVSKPILTRQTGSAFLDETSKDYFVDSLTINMQYTGLSVVNIADWMSKGVKVRMYIHKYVTVM